MTKFLNDLKIKYKLLFIFGLLLFITADAWIFSFTTIRDIDDSFSRLETYALPSVLTTSALKDNLHMAFAQTTDYVNTGNLESKKKFQQNLKLAVNSEVQLFKLAQTEQDFEFTQLFEEQINKLNDGFSTIIEKYEADPINFSWAKETAKLSTLRDEFDDFLRAQITYKAQTQIQEAADKISQTVETMNLYLLIIIFGLIIVAVFLFWFVSTSITHPINILTAAAERMGKGKFEPVNVRYNDELGLFAKTFNKMGEDITQARVALEEELVKTKELDRQKSEFLSIAAHQLRTPMAGIKWVMQMTADGDLGPVSKEQVHHLSQGLENSERMIKLINNLLDITRLEEQKFKYKLEKIELTELLKNIIAGLSGNALQKKITVKLITSEKSMFLLLDKEKIQIAINNLIDNAIKYSPLGNKVQIRLIKNQGKVRIEIQDWGYGIPEKQKIDVFTKFFRGSNILKIQTEYSSIGTGLGLYLAKDIIEKHEGKIWFDSTENKGTTFYIELPIKK